jgi:hypothetical protein
MFPHLINAENFPMSKLCVNTFEHTMYTHLTYIGRTVYQVKRVAQWTHKHDLLLLCSYAYVLYTRVYIHIYIYMWALGLEGFGIVPGGVTEDFVCGIRHFHVPGVNAASKN